MVDKNKALIVVILDRSGSMSSIRTDMIGGFKTFIDEQKKEPGECAVSLYQFDDRHEVVYENKPIAEVGELVLSPRDNTALYDAVGRSVSRVGRQLAELPEDKRPGAVIVMIITDGQENASREYTGAGIKTIVTEQEKDYNWRFMYLGASASTFADAKNIGIQMRSVGSYQANTAGVNNMYSRSSKAASNLRSAVRKGVSDVQLNVDPDTNGPGV